MLRRALQSFVPAFLALAFLCGMPVAGIGGLEANAAPSIASVADAPVAHGNLTQDVVPGGTLSQSADEDDTPDDRFNRTVTDDDDSTDDRVVRIAVAVIWPTSALDAPSFDTSGVTGPTHRPCAAPPRAPPIA